MNHLNHAVAVVVFLLAPLGAVAQQSPPQSGATPPPGQGVTSVRGCLNRLRGNYLLIEDQTSLVYVLKGVGNKLDNQVHHQVEVKGRVLPGTVKTGIRSQKEGSNPSDTVHGADGVPFQVADVQSDVHTISTRCKAADQQ
jgi:hypothetical protein